MSESSLFHSVITEGKKIILEVVFCIKLWDVVRRPWSMIRIIFRNNIEKILRKLFFNNFLKSTKFVVPTSLPK